MLCSQSHKPRSDSSSIGRVESPPNFSNKAHHDPLSTLLNSRSKKADFSLLLTTKKVGLLVPNASHQIVRYS
jgi:hypothetical protein